jgi:hypothetical protein
MADFRLKRVAIAGCLISVLSGVPALAQEMGVVTGSIAGANDAPLARARIGIAGTMLATMTDAAGGFRVTGVPAGTRTIEVRMLGYSPIALPIDVVAGETFNIRLQMIPEPTVLSTVEIKADSVVNPLMKGFEARRARGMGRFFDRKDIVEMQPRVFTDVLRRVAGMQVTTSAENYGPGTMVQTGRNTGGMGNRPCPVEFYVNGTPLPLVRDGGINHFISPDDVVGVEVYNGASQVPPQFNSGNFNTRCGVVLIWTRSGPEPESLRK